MFAHIEIDESRCKGCALCTIACPRMLLRLREETKATELTPVVITSQEKCVGCALCAGMCPAVAINVFSCQINEFTGKLLADYQILEQKINRGSKVDKDECIGN
jgi:2-oxoglutarate ferredoxin oxidoreductase subunit delta